MRVDKMISSRNAYFKDFHLEDLFIHTKCFIQSVLNLKKQRKKKRHFAVTHQIWQDETLHEILFSVFLPFEKKIGEEEK